MLSYWIINSIDKPLRSVVPLRNTVKELWDELQERYGIGNAPKMYQLKAEIQGLHQNGMTVVSYYSKLTALWDELVNLTKASTCVCGKCTCKAPKEHAREKEDEKLMQFLLGIDNNFGFSRDQVRELLVLLERNKEGSDNLSNKNLKTFTWILDSEASIHMTGKKDLLRNIKKTNPTAVYLPNGSQIMDTMVGSVELKIPIDIQNTFSPLEDLNENFKQTDVEEPRAHASSDNIKVRERSQEPNDEDGNIVATVVNPKNKNKTVDLNEEVYMKRPPGFHVTRADSVCHLHKSIYGLQQASQNWFNKLTIALKKYDLGQLKHFLGVEVARSTEGLFLCQRKYALDIISETGLLGSKHANIPMEFGHNLQLAKEELVDRGIYQRLEPKKAHLEATLHVVHYLKGSPGQGILLRADISYFMETKKQSIVSKSSSEVEYWALASTTSELVWLKYLLTALQVPCDKPMELYCDNKSAIYIATNLVFHERTKHIEIDCHYVREQVQAGKIITPHLRSKFQLANLFTKALARAQFNYLSSKLGIYDAHAPT
ncbi:retrovirus-related pol polyprotein from transposon RE1 [Tanacetum coccineum]|uniref:Retrovirus-related pol polyprotein from transposon RE1 n=1 Tax=Tanacetum coccineum TaxID=301880 RepID=A0ABQ5ARE1_9ASTR